MREAGKDFNPDRGQSLPLKSLSPDQPPRWNDPYRIIDLSGSLKTDSLQPLIVSQIRQLKALDISSEKVYPFLNSHTIQSSS
jgi:hypothetical protein